MTTMKKKTLTLTKHVIKHKENTQLFWYGMVMFFNKMLYGLSLEVMMCFQITLVSRVHTVLSLVSYF